MTPFVPYVFFNGNCRETMAQYQKLFGGELELMTYGDAQADGCPLALKTQVMHSALKAKSGAILLMASDAPDRAPVQGENVQIAISFETRAGTERVYQALSQSGKIGHPLEQMAWGYFGALFDRFGVG